MISGCLKRHVTAAMSAAAPVHMPMLERRPRSLGTFTAREFYGAALSESLKKRDSQGEDVVELDQDDQRDADPGRKDQAQESRDCVEGLGDQDAPAHQEDHLGQALLPEKLGSDAVFETREQACPEQNDVEPVFDQGDPQPVETSEEQGRERH